MISKFLGSWKLVHCKLLDIDGVEQFDPFHNASGVIMYDANGLMAAQLMQNGHENVVKGNLFNESPEVFKKAFTNYIAYYGLYHIQEDEKIITHSVLGALWPAMVATKLSRRFEFKDNNTMVLSTMDYETNASEKPIMRYLTWSRVASPIDSANFPFKL